MRSFIVAAGVTAVGRFRRRMAEVRLKEGDTVERWRVIKKLGQGSFGAVYEVEDSRDRIKGVRAMKVEETTCKDQVLKIEVAVLTALYQAKLTKHACRVSGTGICSTTVPPVNYLVMTLLGASLYTLHKKANKHMFSKETCVAILYQAKEAIKNMHVAGWLHRDVKPGNFAIGHRSDAANRRVIYILDFGLSRPYTTTKGSLRKARERAAFRGTVAYVSLNGHKGKELGRHDDLLSAIYMLLEFMHGTLPWKHLNTINDIRLSKLQNTAQLLQSLPKSFSHLYDQLNTLTYEDEPQYDKFDEAIGELIDVHNVQHIVPDWEKGDTAEATNRQDVPGPPQEPQSEYITAKTTNRQDVLGPPKKSQSQNIKAETTHRQEVLGPSKKPQSQNIKAETTNREEEMGPLQEPASIQNASSAVKKSSAKVVKPPMMGNRMSMMQAMGQRQATSNRTPPTKRQPTKTTPADELSQPPAPANQQTPADMQNRTTRTAPPEHRSNKPKKHKSAREK